MADGEGEVSRMADMMTFPNTVEEFMEQYKIIDNEKIYTNGTELIPIFRMMQWFEHVSATDTISRQAAIDAIKDRYYKYGRFAKKDELIYALEKLPPAQPKQRTGKWIKITKGAMHEKYMCSACGRTIEEDGIERLVPIKYPFCHCGAKMEGAANND